MTPPPTEQSTQEARRAYVLDAWKCLHDCESCGKCRILKGKDAETLYALRRLAIWKGDVYVREPSGSGYWANVSVSFNKTYSEMVIPVTLSITRVEGGM